MRRAGHCSGQSSGMHRLLIAPTSACSSRSEDKGRRRLVPKGGSIKEHYRTVLLSNLAPTASEELEVSVKALVHGFRVGGIVRISCPADARSTKKLSTRAFIVFSTLERAGRAVAALDGYRLVLSTGTDFKAGKAGTLLKAKFLQQLSSSATAEDDTMTAGGLLMLSSDGASWSFTTDVNPPADVRPVTDVVPNPVAWPCPPPVSSLPELRPMLSRWADAVEEEDIDDARLFFSRKTSEARAVGPHYWERCWPAPGLLITQSARQHLSPSRS